MFYDAEGAVSGWTAEPVGFTAYPDDDGAAVVVRSLEMALRDARERPVVRVRDGVVIAG